MNELNAIVKRMTEDMDLPEDIPVSYEVWAIGYDEENNVMDAEMLLAEFDDPDFAVSYAETITLADVVHLAADDEYEADNTVHHILIEVETVVPDENSAMNIGTIYRKQIEVFTEEPVYTFLSDNDFELLEDGNIKVPCELLSDYNKNDCFVAVFKDDSHSLPMTYKIISKTTSGHYICEFV